jgi:hypothetical protein
MKANDLPKVSLTLDEIYESIKSDMTHNKNTFKHQIPHWIYVCDEVKSRLISDGFKVYIGNWDGILNNSLIIEW